MRIKQIILRLFFCTEIIMYGYYYWYGSHGVCAAQTIARELEEVESEIMLMRKKINRLENELTVLSTDDFYAQKFAREHLQMGKKGDVVYIL